jgi:hypothetical protein
MIVLSLGGHAAYLRCLLLHGLERDLLGRSGLDSAFFSTPADIRYQHKIGRRLKLLFLTNMSDCYLQCSLLIAVFNA